MFFMKNFMNILVLLSIFVCCQRSISCSQYPLQYVASSNPISHENVNQTRNEHENKIKIRYSQALWQDRKTLQSKKDQIAGFAQCIQNNQAIANHYKNLHEQAKNLQIDRYSFDDLFGMGCVNPQAFTPLKYASISRISIDMQELAQLKSMTESDQWQYFNEYKDMHKDDCPGVYDVSTLIHYLENQLHDAQEKITASVHAMRSKNIAAQYFSLYASVHNIVQFYAQYLQLYKQEEHNIRNDMIAKFDAQSAKSQTWIRLAHKLSERSLDTTLYQQHKLLQIPINQDIIIRGKQRIAARKQDKKLRLAQKKAVQLEIEQQKVIEQQVLQNAANQEKAERALMDAEELYTIKIMMEQRIPELLALQNKLAEQQKIIVCAEQEIVQEQKIVATIEQEKLKQDATNKEDAASIARPKTQREKDRLKAQRQKQRKKEVTSSLGIKQDQAEVLIVDQNKIDKVARYEQFMINLDHEYNLRNTYARSIKKMPGLTFEKEMIYLREYDQKNEVCSCFNLLKMYTELVCEADITDEKLKRLEEFSEIIIVDIDNGLQSKKHHLAWYLYADKKLCKKICDRYKELHALYYHPQIVLTMQHSENKYAFDSWQAGQLLSEYKYSLTQATIALKKSMQDKEPQEMQKEKKVAMESWILHVKNQDENFKKICSLYKSFGQEVLAAKLYQTMKKLHDAGCVLDVDRLSSPDLDIVSW